MPSPKKIINVASVPQRSPFRYPGGKTWLVPHVRQWLKSQKKRPIQFVEPFAGGGIISLTVAFERLSENILMYELDDAVASVWKTIFSRNSEWLAKQILEFEFTAESVKSELSSSVSSIRQQAFHTVLRNRVCHGGIMAHGSGFIKNGENGKGIRSRWYPETLARRIREIGTVRQSITFVHGDGIEGMKSMIGDSDYVFFIDPPYTAAGKKAGKRLYQFNELDHDLLFDTARSLKGDFLMTYDNAEEVVEMARMRGFDTESVPMKNTHHTTMTELLIGRDLDWARKMFKSNEQQKVLF